MISFAVKHLGAFCCHAYMSLLSPMRLGQKTLCQWLLIKVLGISAYTFNESSTNNKDTCSTKNQAVSKTHQVYSTRSVVHY